MAEWEGGERICDGDEEMRQVGLRQLRLMREGLWVNIWRENRAILESL